MIFLIKYHRKLGKILELIPFKDSEEMQAEDKRLEYELELLSENNFEHEVLLLEAVSETALRKTHSRYFKTAREIAST